VEEIPGTYYEVIPQLYESVTSLVNMARNWRFTGTHLELLEKDVYQVIFLELLR